MEKTYDVDYFIEKFEAIPEKLWAIGILEDGDRHCAMGHCGVRHYNTGCFSWEAMALGNIFITNLGMGIVFINDRSEYSAFQQPTPKKRILAALRYIKSKQYPELTHPPVTAEQVIEQLEGVIAHVS